MSWVSYLGREKSVRLHQEQKKSIAGKPRGQLCRRRFDLWSQPKRLYSKPIAHTEFLFSFLFFFTLRVGLIPTQTSAPNAHTSPPIYFIWAADADDKLILRTNSIITNNPRCWQAHKKSLDEWVVYLLQCTQCWAQARPAKMPLHYEAAEQECSTACPCDQGLAHRKLDISFCIPQQQSSGRKCLDGLFSSLKCHL